MVIIVIVCGYLCWYFVLLYKNIVALFIYNKKILRISEFNIIILVIIVPSITSVDFELKFWSFIYKFDEGTMKKI